MGFGINQLSSGGDFYSVGGEFWNADSGIRNISNAAAALTLAQILGYVGDISGQTMGKFFPLDAVTINQLYLAIFAAEVSQFWAHGMDDTPPFGGKRGCDGTVIVGLIVITFIGFILKRAVTDTRDLHVEERHWHPDPRQVDLAMRETIHSLHGVRHC